MASKRKTETAIFAAGCFWGVQELYRTLAGVLSTRAGYTGGSTLNPTYEEVCSDATGHAEAVQIVFDPGQVSYDALLALFFGNHDPTTRNRQGFDVGSQYRSAVFYHSESQKRKAEAAKKALQEKLDAESKKSVLSMAGLGRRTVVTQILPAQTFWPAEEYHQEYLAKRGAKVCH